VSDDRPTFPLASRIRHSTLTITYHLRVIYWYWKRIRFFDLAHPRPAGRHPTDNMNTARKTTLGEGDGNNGGEDGRTPIGVKERG